MYWVLLMPHAPDGGAIAIWREGAPFAARISLTNLAVFAMEAEKEHERQKGKS